MDEIIRSKIWLKCIVRYYCQAIIMRYNYCNGDYRGFHDIIELLPNPSPSIYNIIDQYKHTVYTTHTSVPVVASSAQS